MLTFWLLAFYLINPWQDFLILSNQLIQPERLSHKENPVVFVQIDEDFLNQDLPMAAQFEDWGALLGTISEQSPRAILVDYQMSSHRYEKTAPGAAARFEEVLATVADRTALVMGVSPGQTGGQQQPEARQGIRYPTSTHLGCMYLSPNHDGVIREFRLAFPEQCPDWAALSIAGAAALALGQAPQAAGLLLPPASPLINQIKARDVLDNPPTPGAPFRNAIVVVGSNFPNEDEHLSSHVSTLGFFHAPVKGAVVHAVHLQSHLNGHVAWTSQSDWLLIGLLSFLFIGLFAASQGVWALPLGVVSVLLLSIDFVSTVFLKQHFELFYWAAGGMAAVLVVRLNKVIADLLLKRKIETLLGSLLSPAVMAKCLQDPEGFFVPRRMPDSTVLVLDIQGYSAESARIDVDELYRCTNLLMSYCTRIIHNNGGCVERFRGDGLLAYFGAPVETKDHFEHALESAMEILQAIDANAPSGLGSYQQRIRIGISRGELILGRVGDKNRFDIAVTGQSANRAAHFESLADPQNYPIVVDEQSLAASSRQWHSTPLGLTHPKHPLRPLRGLGRVLVNARHTPAT